MPVAAAVMTLSIGGAAFAASSADTTTTAAGAPAAITSQAPAPGSRFELRLPLR